jgi:hypothetical protein
VIIGTLSNTQETASRTPSPINALTKPKALMIPITAGQKNICISECE